MLVELVDDENLRFLPFPIVTPPAALPGSPSLLGISQPNSATVASDPKPKALGGTSAETTLRLLFYPVPIGEARPRIARRLAMRLMTLRPSEIPRRSRESLA